MAFNDFGGSVDDRRIRAERCYRRQRNPVTGDNGGGAVGGIVKHLGEVRTDMRQGQFTGLSSPSHEQTVQPM